MDTRRSHSGAGSRRDYDERASCSPSIEIRHREGIQCNSGRGHRERGLGRMHRFPRSSERISSLSTNLPRIPALLYVLDLTGVAVFPISGALTGVHRGLDLFGIAVVAAVTAIGGGPLRDLGLHRHPAFWVNDPW